MASFLKIYHHRNEISDKFFDLLAEAEVNREKEFLAALKIQSAFHRFIFRQIIAERNRNALIIQRHFRMYRAQMLLRCLFIEKEQKIRADYFNQMALKIQNAWKQYVISHDIEIGAKPRELCGSIKIRKVIKKRKTNHGISNDFNDDFHFEHFSFGSKLKRAPR